MKLPQWYIKQLKRDFKSYCKMASKPTIVSQIFSKRLKDLEK